MARAKICPQRIIKEAIRIIELYQSELGHADSTDLDEEITNNLLELNDLQERLYQQGIINL